MGLDRIWRAEGKGGRAFDLLGAQSHTSESCECQASPRQERQEPICKRSATGWDGMLREIEVRASSFSLFLFGGWKAVVVILNGW